MGDGRKREESMTLEMTVLEEKRDGTRMVITSMGTGCPSINF
jgi:hypothetical protein